eukprot:2376200-Pleurochrysis_carterae.AAC.2
MRLPTTGAGESTLESSGIAEARGVSPETLSTPPGWLTPLNCAAYFCCAARRLARRSARAVRA